MNNRLLANELPQFSHGVLEQISGKKTQDAIEKRRLDERVASEGAKFLL